MSHHAMLRAPRANAATDFAALDSAAFAAVCLESCTRLAAMRRTAAARHLDDLVAAGAWTDAALALVAIECPGWGLRRLAYDDGAWHCALSNQRDMPDWLGNAVEAHHTDMAIAILQAFRAVVGRAATFPEAASLQDRVDESRDVELMTCENYA